MNRIIVPVDGSAFAEQAIDTARAIAARTGAGLKFVAVLEPLLPPSRVTGAPPLDPRFDVELRGSRAEYLKRLEQAERQRGTVAVTSVLREGNPSDEIANYASAQGDLIVMTTHGRGGFERLWLGSVADGVIRASSVPVLLVRKSSGAEAGGGVALNRVVVALAGAQHDDVVAHAVLKVTDPVRATYTLVHVTPPSPTIAAVDPAVGPPPDEMAGVQADVSPKHGAAATAYLEFMAQTFREQTASVETRVTRAGGAGRAIVDLAREVGANLIATGTAARGPVARVLMGSVADKIVRSAECSVLVIPTTAGLAELTAATPATDAISERF